MRFFSLCAYKMGSAKVPRIADLMYKKFYSHVLTLAVDFALRWECVSFILKYGCSAHAQLRTAALPRLQIWSLFYSK